MMAAALVALLLAAEPAPAVPAPPPQVERAAPERVAPAGLIVELHSDFGLRRFIALEYTSGRRFGLALQDGISAAVGASVLRLAGGRLSTRVTAGFKLQLVRASNGSATFTAFPVELAESLELGPLRLGAGASVLLAPTLRGRGFLEGARIDFDPAPGAVLDAEWLVSRRSRTGIGLRASWHHYQGGGVRRGAPAIGLVVRSELGTGGR
ncbi:conserved hypothetical protein [Anaeromyxobacter sp. K]|uniref:hypothetical protein n=1 Tax=Anaeromyxobacter sp. (strain K) TaxID=447217 RepID=UPI00015F8AD2|nr:hypothetical protein [Anaeromyxobacter sp. K]ACG74257.1 conserved hypothetical protein [Anaeromyxobacter sp. K]